jgi:hypothetical protein
MARPQLADRGDGLQVWRVAVNILIKQSRTADEGWSSGVGLVRGLTTPHRKIPARYVLGVAGCYEHGNERSGSVKVEVFLLE